MSMVVKTGLSLLGPCKDMIIFIPPIHQRLKAGFYPILHLSSLFASNLDDKCQPFWEICHYKSDIAFVNIVSMFRQDYAQLSIFAGMDGDQINQLSPFMVECNLPKDQVIFEQGQAAKNLYILLCGEVVINYKPYDGPSLVVAHIEPGGVFGWSAALQREVYTSGALAIKDSLACSIRGSDLNVICDQYPETGHLLLERLAGVIAQRLHSTHSQVLGILTQGVVVNAKTSRRSSKNDRK